MPRARGILRQHFGDEEHLLPAALDRLADDQLSIAVHFGGVDMVHAERRARPQRGDGLGRGRRVMRQVPMPMTDTLWPVGPKVRYFILISAENTQSRAILWARGAFRHPSDHDRPMHNPVIPASRRGRYSLSMGRGDRFCGDLAGYLPPRRPGRRAEANCGQANGSRLGLRPGRRSCRIAIALPCGRGCGLTCPSASPPYEPARPTSPSSRCRAWSA